MAIETPDPAETIRTIASDINDDTHPKYRWDLVDGLAAINEAATVVITSLAQRWADSLEYPPEGDPVEPFLATTRGSFSSALSLFRTMPPRTLMAIQLADRFLDDPAAIQMLWSLRDEAKRDGRTLILLGMSFNLPDELRSDVIVLDEPLPSQERIETIVRSTFNGAQGLDWEVTDEVVTDAASVLRGTSAFAAEQLAALSIRKSAFDRDSLRSHSRKQIEQTPGLSIDQGGETFDDVGGLDRIKEFASRLFSGPQPPRLVVRVEELEKAMAGTQGDLSGTSSDALQVVLSEMEDNDWSGILAYGIPGSGKSIFSKSMANSFGALPMRFDINACKGSLVGESERRVRAAIKTIKAIGGSDVFFVASVNSLDAIPPELQRRFRAGTYFFDQPTAAEQLPIWDINLRRFGLSQEWTGSDQLTGADIRNICELAYKLDCTLDEAAEFTVSMASQSPRQVAVARRAAHNRFLSANSPGVYEMAQGEYMSPPMTIF